MALDHRAEAAVLMRERRRMHHYSTGG